MLPSEETSLGRTTYKGGETYFGLQSLLLSCRSINFWGFNKEAALDAAATTSLSRDGTKESRQTLIGNSGECLMQFTPFG